jgi:NADPH2:quinone reductase
MRAARMSVYGPAELLTIDDIDDPVAGPGEIVVGIEAAAVNYPDLLIMSGDYQVKWPLPLIPGSEYAGTVLSVGPGVQALQPGDRVGGSVAVGAFAEQLAVAAKNVWVLPDSVEMAEAAAFRVTYLTSYHALRSVADVQPGEWVVVLGAAGGVGIAAIDIAKLLGARVIAVASSAHKLQVCRERGADATIDYTTEDLKQRIKDITGGGANVVIDPVGGPYSEAALRATAWGGRFVCIGFASGEIPHIPLNLVLLKGVIVLGMEIRTFGENRPEAAARDEAEAFEHFAAGRLRPFVEARFTLDETFEALLSVRDRRAVGKVVISP